MTLERAYQDGYKAGLNEWKYDPPKNEAEKEAYNKGWAKGWDKRKNWEG